MDEYTFKNIIIDPTKEGIESLIGKEVYVSNIPNFCLDYANDNEYKKLGVLTELKINDSHPFVVKHGSCSSSYICIIPKERKTKYVPFENQKEFVRAHQKFKESIKHGTFESNLADCGIWLKNKQTKSCSMVIEIESKGVALGGNILSNDWQDLFEYYTFIDGSPCGKEVEE